MLAEMPPAAFVRDGRRLAMAAELRHHMNERLETALRGIGWNFGK